MWLKPQIYVYRGRIIIQNILKLTAIFSCIDDGNQHCNQAKLTKIAMFYWIAYSVLFVQAQNFLCVRFFSSKFYYTSFHKEQEK